MLNPSTADAEKDDATIRSCMGYAKAWGYGGIDVVNLYAYRATQPPELWKAADPVGPLNDEWLIKAVHQREVAIIVGAWGCNARTQRIARVRSLLLPAIYQLGEYAFPRHPLRLSKTLQPVLWKAYTGSPCMAKP